MEISELREKVKHTDHVEFQMADQAQSQLIIEDLVEKAAFLERNLENEKKEKENAIHEILNLNMDLKKKDDEIGMYVEDLKALQDALTKEETDRETLGEEARQKLQEHRENERKLVLKVKEMEREVERWKKEVDLHVEAEAKLMENRGEETEASPEKPQEQQSPQGILTVMCGTLIFDLVLYSWRGIQENASVVPFTG